MSAKLQTFHMGQSITGPLLRWKKADWRRATSYIKKDDGTKYTAGELEAVFKMELAKGHEVVPMGKCDNWDWKTGCKGHPQES